MALLLLPLLAPLFDLPQFLDMSEAKSRLGIEDAAGDRQGEHEGMGDAGDRMHTDEGERRERLDHPAQSGERLFVLFDGGKATSGPQTCAEFPFRPSEPRIPGELFAQHELAGTIYPVAEDVVPGEIEEFGDEIGGAGRQEIEGGGGETRQGQASRIELFRLTPPFRRDRLGESRRGQAQFLPLGRAQRPAVEPHAKQLAGRLHRDFAIEALHRATISRS
ncbi:hypothetical protein HRbin40_01392 [bacterium HR40]|nr:hypothetical protein HRbin40_01392 [bacterium HR40]